MTRIQLPPLARQALDRDYLLRSDPNWLQKVQAQSSSRVLVMHQGKVLLVDSQTPVLKLLAPKTLVAADYWIYLGRCLADTSEVSKGSELALAIVGKDQADEIEPDPKKWVSLRSTGAGLSDLDAGVFTQALAISNWHAANVFCPSCGGKTKVEMAGWVRRCEAEDKELFPRTDPAIIVSILDQDDRILLGSQGVWEENRWSILAGFVEPGESLEAAVVREMKEECGLDVSNAQYIYSQAWPYPCSLMLGFSARADSKQLLNPDGQEIVKLRWFSRDELIAEASEILLPGRASISRAMIEHWLGQKIESATETVNNGHQ